mmetsp:Transcript_9457/g.14540  ORF Transcript_9457/g.14540 Transcript_9457/m.14540 type:complete len:382 (-) Transcript_9457:117-1262(-)|eukprot:CAMPEP_0195308012 /NCGR_PEP_ID=MMETSP0707-20130614/38008_1 /TAXON_ID=33640 /ORGANISM="Asterionellopsis glacialis, Strain CCMP134" /LENGTH=381 /DNA_ID=CAMNT_0040372271 /DNA_START=58 /DNA_END=1203 /DNA_ORIENTATION=+
MSVTVPCVDFSSFLDDSLKKEGGEGVLAGLSPTPEQLKTASQLDQACRDHGFVALTNFGVSQSMVDEAFDASKSMFIDNSHQSHLWRRIHPSHNMGYAPFQSEQLNPSRLGDLKESFNVRFPPAHVNDFSGCPPEFVDASEQLLQAFRSASYRYAIACAVALGLHEEDEGKHKGRSEDEESLHLFSSTLEKMDLCTVRFLHYPPLINKGENLVTNNGDTTTTTEYGKIAIRAGEHTDFGAFTFLLLAPGALESLQIKPVDGGEISNNGEDSDEGWLNLVLETNDTDKSINNASATAIVNTGALMARWTNDYWRATAHRVITHPALMAEHRYSIACFVDPDAGALVDVHERFLRNGEEKKYPPIKGLDYLLMKLRECQTNVK